MYQINTITKKFTEAVTIDLGQLPTVDTRIDFILTDGTNPVIAENKTFAMTIGTVEGTLYKTDEDTVSFRYLKFDSGNVSSTLPITIKMDGVEILNDTVSLTYQTSGGGSSVTVDNEMSESSPNPVANSTLTPIINGKADKATTLAGYGIADAYTKTEVDAKVSSVYHYRGTVSAYADLPASGQEVGDVWNIETADSAHGIKAGDNVAWTGSAWDALSGEVDLTPFALKADAATDHNHDARYVKLEGRTQVVNNSFGIYDTYNDDPALAKRNGPIIAKEGKFIRIGGNDNNDKVILSALTLTATFQGSPNRAIWFEDNGVTKFGFNFAEGTLNAETGFKEAGVLLSDKYAAKSHTHAMGDITGLPASGGTAGQVLTKTDTGAEWNDLPDTTDYLCFTATQANSTVRLDKQGTPPAISLEYSTDKKTWTEYTWDGNTGATITLANIGDNVWWRGDNTAFSSNGNFYKFAMTGSIEASGNVMSLLDKTCQSVTIPTEYCFFYLFSWSGVLKTAPELPATKLAINCYSRMFMGCSSLTTAPELPATTMADYCYNEMFSNCTSLTKAPELPATTLANHCCENMFYGCSKLNKVKVSFTSWGNNFNFSWLMDVSSNGVFECPSDLNCSTRDASHVPAGWTIVRTDSPKSITSPTTASSEATYQVSPNTPSVPVVTVSSALTLNVSTIDSGSVAYAEIVLDVATGATVTAGTNLTLVDTPTAGKRNICVCRWSGGVCKLYVTIVEDLPQA